MDYQQAGFSKILIVDDEQGVLNAIQRLLHDESYEVLTASRGMAALELLRLYGPVQLIISDYRMPGMNGVELLQQVMQQWPDTRRVILSAYPDTDNLLAAVNEGRVHRFMVKPWDNDALKSIIREMLDEYRIIIDFRRDAEELVRNNRLLSRTNEHLSAILGDVLANMRSVSASVPEGVMTPTGASSNLLKHKPHDTLSPREFEIFLALGSGQTSKGIASELGLSIKTVSTYKKRIFDKMGFRNDTELVIYSLKNNLLPENHL
jgi:DNA-binding NarL/FixJ family response regulator